MYDYGYPTGVYGATPQMQDRLAQMESQQRFQRQQQMPNYLMGHMVTGIEEARSAQVDFMGKPSYFPSPSEGKVYEKFITPEGVAAFRVYELSKSPEPKPVSSNDISALQDKVLELERIVKGLEGGLVNGHDEHDESDGNVTRNGKK